MGQPEAVLVVDDDDLPVSMRSAAQPPAPAGTAAAADEEVVVLLSDDSDAAPEGSASAAVPSGHADSATGSGDEAAPPAKRRRRFGSVVGGLGGDGGDGGDGGGGSGNETDGNKACGGQGPIDAGTSVRVDGASGGSGAPQVAPADDAEEVVDLVNDEDDEEEAPPQQPPPPPPPAVPSPSAAAATPSRSPLFATPIATRRLLRELAALSATGPTEGIRVTPIDDNLYIWRLAMTFADEAQPRKLDADFAAAAIDPVVTFEVRFPGDYPIVPPFVRVLSPIFLYPSTFVDPSGALCIEVLSQGWAPAVGMTGLAMCVKATLLSVDARLDVARSRGGGGYGGGVREAMSAFRGMAASHGWRVPDAQAVVGDDSAMFPGGR